eukprot:15269830-Ditylum_brightwellii.AAC.1
MLAGTKYNKQNNKDYNITVNPNWRKHKPKPATLISNQLLVTYNMTQEMNNKVKANRPDIVVLDEKEHKILIIDVTVLMDINMIKAAASALGTICQNLDGLFALVLPRANLELIQKEVLLRLAHILHHT